jgi:cytochrome b
MLSGLLLGLLLLWRIFWGLFGTRHARLSGFSLNPVDLKNYLFGILSGTKKYWPGHNPASSWAALTMLALGLGLSLTGYLMTTGQKETFEDAHEFMANTFIVIALMHIAGVLLHMLRYGDGIALSMLDGKKELIDSSESINSSKRFSAAILISLFISSGLYIFKNFDSHQRKLDLFGQTLQLGEMENQKNND